MSDGLAGKLSRWSQRKLAARGRASPVPLDEPDAAPANNAQQPVQEARRASPADPLHSEKQDAGQENVAAEAELQLPPVDELDFNSDYTQFFAKGVPENLRRAALRKLWRSDPVLACLDGLNDYDEDYNLIDTLITPDDTSYKVGRGFLDELEAETPDEQAAASGGEQHDDATGAMADADPNASGEEPRTPDEDAEKTSQQNFAEKDPAPQTAANVDPDGQASDDGQPAHRTGSGRDSAS